LAQPPPPPSWEGGSTPPPPPGGGTPWDRRGQIGFLPALFETTKEVLATPTEFFRRMAVTGGIGGPLLYALILGYFGVVVSAVYDTVFSTVMGDFASWGRRGELERFLPLLEGGGSLLFRLLLGPFMILFFLFLASGIYHLVLLVLGGAQRGFEATFRVVSFSQATSVLMIVPMCGAIVALVYYVVVAIIGLSEAHGTSRGTAAAAVLLPILLVCCCCVVAGVAGVGMIGGLAGMWGGQGH
jgi:hypothetical protein